MPIFALKARGTAKSDTSSFYRANSFYTANFHAQYDFFLLRNQRCRLDLRLHSFSERVINLWNNLDDQTVSALSLNRFKSNFTRLRNSGIGLFVDKFVYRP